MNRLPNRRFKISLSSSLSILAIFAAVYSISQGIQPAIAADGPQVTATKSTPGKFKDLPETSNTITAKQLDEAPAKNTDATAPDAAHNTASTRQSINVDSNKGVTPRLSDQKEESELQDFHATAYCLKGRTASGHYTRRGVIAADPRVLPIGTVVEIKAGRYTGTYTVLDTGGRIKGRKVDVYVPTYKEAKQFGRQRIKIKVLGRSKAKADPASKSRVSG